MALRAAGVRTAFVGGEEESGKEDAAQAADSFYERTEEESGQGCTGTFLASGNGRESPLQRSRT